MLLLRKEGQYNNLSDELIKKLEDKVEGFGKVVRYKFDISNPNPDPQKYGGEVLWPNMYTLDPAVFYINDPKTKKTVQVALIDSAEPNGTGGTNFKFRKIKIDGKYKGILSLYINGEDAIEEHKEFAMYLELHPKLANGEFSDKTKRQMFSRIDEQAAAVDARKLRSARKKATDVAENMNLKELKNFADAMLWDSTQDELLLRNQVEELAETTPDFFNDLVEGKNVEYQAVVKQAIDRNIILFNPADYSFVYSGNKQPIAILSPSGEESHVIKMANWLQSGGTKEQEVYKKIKSLVEGK